MAFREIDPGPDDSANFFSFKAIGDRFLGRFVSFDDTKMGNFNKPEMRYTFKAKVDGVIGTFVVSANHDLNRRLKKAELKPGHVVEITYTSDLPNADPTKSAMRQFKVRVDDSPTPGAAAAPKPPTPPPPAANELDDIPL